MALVLLAVLYAALAAALAILAGWLGRPWGRAELGRQRSASERVLVAAPKGRRWTQSWPPLFVVCVLTLLPLFFTIGGFLPNQTLAPTPLLSEVAPWAEPHRVYQIRLEATANPLLLDPLSQFIPWREAARHDWLINPAQGGGAALLGNGQSAVLYPTEILARALPPFRAATFSQAARLLVAGWGMFLLVFRLLVPVGSSRSASSRGGLRPAPGFADLPVAHLAALAAAGVWMGCGFVQVWRLHPHTLVAATVPWILFALLRLVRAPGPAPAVGLAAAGAMAVTAGHPETLFHALLFGLLLVGLVAWSDGRGTGARGAAPPEGAEHRRTAFGPVIGWGAVAALLAALLAAPLLLPFLENLWVSSEWVLRRDSGTVVEVELEESLQRLSPTFALYSLGDPRVDAETAEESASWLDPWTGPWDGPENLSELAGGWTGAVALFLAFLALGHPDRRLRLLARGLLVVGAVGLLVSVHLPVLSRPFGAVPLLRESLLKRLSLWWALAVSLGAGLGMQRWLRGKVNFYRGPLWSAAAAAMAVSLASAGPFRAPAAVTLGEWVPLLAVAVVTCLVPYLGGRPGDLLRERAAVLLVLAALLAPSMVLLGGWVPTVGASGFYPQTPATRFVAEELHAAGPVGYRVAGLQAALVPHSASFFGFGDPRVYDPMTYAPYAEFISHAGVASETHGGWTALTDPASPFLTFLGVRYVFEHPHSGRRPGIRVAHSDYGAVVYENPRALPRVFVPRQVDVYGTPEEAVAAAGEVADFADRVTLSGLDTGAFLALHEFQRLPVGAATVSDLEVAPRTVRATLDAEADSLAATSQPAIPGWRVLLDGRDVDPVAVNGAFLGVVVPPGRHTVELVYAPLSWRVGLGLGMVGLGLAVALLALSTWRRRRTAGAGAAKLGAAAGSAA